MNRDSNYEEAKYRVKISHFTEQGFDIMGVVHVGTNDGYELEWYQKMGIEYFMGFEPLHSAVREFYSKYRVDFNKVVFLPFALGEFTGLQGLIHGSGDGQSSSFREELTPKYLTDFVSRVPVYSFKDLMNIYYFDLSKYDCLVVDVQGMELEVLKGFGDYLKRFKFLNIECSKTPVYRGEATADEVIDYLDAWGFDLDSEVEEHNDVFFIKRGLK